MLFSLKSPVIDEDLDAQLEALTSYNIENQKNNKSTKIAEKLLNNETQMNHRTETLKNKKARTHSSSVVLSSNNSQQQSSTSNDLKIALSIANNSMAELKNERKEKNR
jgi:hypothetical protein